MEKERYKAQISLPGIGIAGQEKLQAAKVLVVGAGGLGCPALMSLVTAGVGSVGIVDHDVIELSNLPRQSLYPESTVGEYKAGVAAGRLKELNLEVNIVAHQCQLKEDNAEEIIAPYDVVLDCTDAIPGRYVINDACVALDKPFIYGGIHRFEGQMSVFNYQGGPTYRCLYPERNDASPPISCSEAGVLGTLPQMIGTWQANEAIKVILEMPGVWSGKLLNFNLMDGMIYKVAIKRKRNMETPVLPVSSAVKEISPRELKEMLDNKRSAIRLVDLRELDEMPEIEELKEIRLPMSEMSAWLNDLDTGKSTVLYCQHGQRSRHLARLLTREYDMKHVWSLTGGIRAWQETFKHEWI